MMLNVSPEIKISLKTPLNPPKNSNKVSLLMKQLHPLTLPYTDSLGYTSQLWEFNCQCIGTVVNQNEQFLVIPEHKIINPLFNQVENKSLLPPLKQTSPKKWALVFDIIHLSLTIWPWLEAAGRTKDQYSHSEAMNDFNHRLNKIIYDNGALNYKHYKAFRKEQKGEPLLTKEGKPLLNPKDKQPYDHIMDVKNYQSAARNLIMEIKKRMGRMDDNPTQMKDLEKILSKASRILDDSRKFTTSASKKEHFQPSLKNFQQKIQNTKLQDSYNSANPNRPIPQRGGNSGQIGGVACGTSYIEGLFNNPESFFENEHAFFVPRMPDGKMPFSNLELKQILRELAIGIYVHDTIPFFSLHFNEQSDLYPIIHPAYENTLVGRVISMLDYIMKGYLNGGVFNEKFIDEWHSDPNWEKRDGAALKEMIDFHQYCEEHQISDYMSLRELQQKMGIEIDPEAFQQVHLDYESPSLKEFKGFRNSFRIIAKQNTIQKKDNLFVIDADFDVLYTIEPSLEYKVAVQDYAKKHLIFPPSYQKLEQAYQLFCVKIHDHMVKLPLCRDYFAMLGIINFFSGYFSTLKAYRKIPVLPSMAPLLMKKVPLLFPSLPIRASRVETLKINERQLIEKIVDSHTEVVKSYFLSIQKEPEEFPKSDTLIKQSPLFQAFQSEIKLQFIAFSSVPREMCKEIDQSKEAQKCSHDLAISFVKRFEESAKKFIARMEKSFPKLFKEKMSLLLETVNSNIWKDFNTRVSKQKGLIDLYTDDVCKAASSENPISKDFRELLLREMNKCSLSVTSTHPNFLCELESIFDLIESELIPIIQNWHKDFFALYPADYADNQKKIISLPFSQLRLITELKASEIQKGEKIVGGCGMRLEQQAVQISHLASSILADHHKLLRQINFEEWSAVNYSSKENKGFVFRLALEDVPAHIHDTYEWMENTFFTSSKSEDSMRERLDIERAMDLDNVLHFNELINESKNLVSMKDASNRTLIHKAASVQNSLYLETLIAKKLSVSEQDLYGYQPIHYAAMKGSIYAIELLLQAGGIKLLNAKSLNGCTPLITAIQYDQLKSVKYLLELGAAFNKLDDDYNTIHCAIHQGNLKIIELILNDYQSTKFINQMSKEGGTPLAIACELGLPWDLIEKIITLGANPNKGKSNGVTPLEIAVQQGNISLINTLLKYDVAISSHVIEKIAKESLANVLNIFLSKSYFYNYNNFDQDNILHLAIRYGNSHGAIAIIEHYQMNEKNEPSGKSLLTFTNKLGEAPYSLAAQLGNWEVFNLIDKKIHLSSHRVKPCLKKLISGQFHPELGKLIDRCQLSQKELEELALQAAQSGNHEALFLEFRKKGIDLKNLMGPKGWNIFHYLAKSDGILLFKLMSKDQPNLLLALEEEGGKTLPYIAGENHSNRVLKYILEQMKKQNVSLDAHHEDKHLFYSVLHQGNQAGVEIFLKIFGNDQTNLINMRLDQLDRRPLHVAAQIGSLEIIKLLLSRDADITQKDLQGHTALAYAIKLNHEKIITHLLENAKKKIVSALELFLAASQGKIKFLDQLLQFNVAKSDLDEALFLAIQNYNKEAFLKLYKCGASFTYISEKNINPLILACQTGQSDLLKIILQDRESKKTLQNGTRALFEAIQYGHADCVLLLLDIGLGNKEEGAKYFYEQSQIKHLGLEMLFKNTEQYRLNITQFAQLITKSYKIEQMHQLVQAIECWPMNETISIEHQGKMISGTPFQLLLRLHHDLMTTNLSQDIFTNSNLDLNILDDEGNSLVHLLLKAGIFPIGLKNINWELCNHRKKTPLHFAAKIRDSSLLRHILKELKNKKLSHLVNAVDDEGRTPIYEAILYNQENNIDLLIEYGAHLNIYDTHLWTPLVLSYAKMAPSLRVVKKLLECGADPNQPVTSERISPLIKSITIGSDQLVPLLIHHGAQLENSTEGITPMHIAAIGSRSFMINFFASKGFSLEERDGKAGFLPIHFAASRGSPEVIKTILALNPDSINEVIVNCENEETKERSYLKGATPLHIAAHSNNYPAAQELLQQKAHSQIETDLGDTAFSLAALSGSTAIMDLFVQDKLYVNANALKKSIFNAIKRDNIDIATVLYQKGIPINAEIENGLTGIQLASLFGALHVTQWLLSQGADPFHLCLGNENAIQLAAKNSSVAQFALLLEVIGSDLDELYQGKESLLHVAVKAGKLAHVAYLIQHFADINLKDSKGDRPLHLAIQQGNYEMVKLLMACGADMQAISSMGLCVRNLAKQDDEIMQAL
ncbi:ankyrin repeat domain-containing protein [Rhabdochlamydiaceae symbiont of Dictyostelium giganteum]|uniref:ankyrin repeat domain-containing protein n=1 Tax=Rhabdochlamydiaceae symbiont of Dictyostelium giganteum TaxID=3342349 RepID=UPI00384E7390